MRKKIKKRYLSMLACLLLAVVIGAGAALSGFAEGIDADDAVSSAVSEDQTASIDVEKEYDAAVKDVDPNDFVSPYTGERVVNGVGEQSGLTYGANADGYVWDSSKPAVKLAADDDALYYPYSYDGAEGSTLYLPYTPETPLLVSDSELGYISGRYENISVSDDAEQAASENSDALDALEQLASGRLSTALETAQANGIDLDAPASEISGIDFVPENAAIVSYTPDENDDSAEAAPSVSVVSVNWDTAVAQMGGSGSYDASSALGTLYVAKSYRQSCSNGHLEAATYAKFLQIDSDRGGYITLAICMQPSVYSPSGQNYTNSTDIITSDSTAYNFKNYLGTNAYRYVLPYAMNKCAELINSGTISYLDADAIIFTLALNAGVALEGTAGNAAASGLVQHVQTCISGIYNSYFNPASADAQAAARIQAAARGFFAQHEFTLYYMTPTSTSSSGRTVQTIMAFYKLIEHKPRFKVSKIMTDSAGNALSTAADWSNVSDDTTVFVLRKAGTETNYQEIKKSELGKTLDIYASNNGANAYDDAFDLWEVIPPKNSSTGAWTKLVSNIKFTPCDTTVVNIEAKNVINYGSLRVKKTSADTSISDLSSYYDLSTVSFTLTGVSSTGEQIYQNKLQVSKLTDGSYEACFENLPFGTYTLKEVSAGQGFEIASDQTVEITASNRDQSVTVANKPLTGSAELKKVSSNPAATEGNAQYSLAGTTFRLTSSDGKTTYDQKVVKQSDGSYKAVWTDLPLDTYSVEELAAGLNYEKKTEGEIEDIVLTEDSADQAAGFTVSNEPEQSQYGSLTIVKTSSNASLTESDPYYSDDLENVWIRVKSAWDNGAYFTKTKKIQKRETDGTVSYSAVFGEKPDKPMVYGTYTVEECATGPLFSAASSQTVTLSKVNKDPVVTVSFANEPKTTSLSIQKVSSDTTISGGNAGYSLAGFVFTAKQKHGTHTYTLTTNAAGYAEVAGIPVDDYEITETSAPAGWAGAGQVQTAYVGLSGYAFTFEDEPAYWSPGLLLKKFDSDDASSSGASGAQGDASLAGALFRFTVYSGSDGTGSKIMTFDLKTDENGEIYADASHLVSFTAENGKNFDQWKDASGILRIPAGSMTIEEISAPDGYLSSVSVSNILKNSAGTLSPNESAQLTSWSGKTAKGTVAKVTGDSSGKLTVEIPAEVLSSSDSAASLGTAADSLAGGFSYKNTVIRGGVKIIKQDRELNASEALGGKNHEGAGNGHPTLAGAVFSLKNASADSVYVNGRWYAPGAQIMTLTTAWDGSAYSASTASDALPYGRYTLTETTAPEGYQTQTDPAVLTFEIKQNGRIVTADSNGDQLAYPNQVIRGDFSFTKVGADGRALQTAWIIRNETTGEEHLIATKANGSYTSYTSSGINAHTLNTNANDSYLSAAKSGRQLTMADLNSTNAGLWFAQGESGSKASADNSLGALIYGSYTATEVRTDTNFGYALTSFRFTVDGTKTNVNLNQIVNDNIDIGTTLAASNNQHLAEASYSESFTDRVSYTSLTPGLTYTMRGRLVNKETGAVIASAQTVFTPDAPSGTVDVVFSTDTSELAGSGAAAFEYLYDRYENLIASHEDITDEDQTVRFPVVETTLATSEGHKDTASSDIVTLVDTVSYKGLIPGESYTVTGSLYEKNSGVKLSRGGSDSNQVTLPDGTVYTRQVTDSSVTFTAPSESGTVDVRFIVPKGALESYTVVAYETLTHSEYPSVFDKTGKKTDVFVTSHEDLSDSDQTVYFPKIGTQASLTKLIPQNGDGTIVITDTVSYDSLIPGQAYRLEGTLMNKDTGEVLLDTNGKAVTASSTFTPKTASGTQDVVFRFDGSSFTFADTVVFENCFNAATGAKVADHSDLSDEAQSLYFSAVMPVTGDAGIYAGIAAGLFVMGASLVIIRRKTA